MKARVHFFLIVLAVFSSLATAPASTTVPTTLDQQVRSADAIFRGIVLAVNSFRAPDGSICTRTILRVDEGFKGTLPPIIKLVHRGGIADGVSYIDNSAPQFRPGEDRLIFVNRRLDGTLFASQGAGSAQKVSSGSIFLQEVRAASENHAGTGANVTDQAAEASETASASGSIHPMQVTANGLSHTGDGIAARFTAPDRSEPIPYLVDAAVLPAGISLSTALSAVSNAFNAWSAACPIRFYFAGTQGFGTAAGLINTNDGIIRIQLHDSYGYITETNLLGKGGRYAVASLLPGAGWGSGGKVGSLECHQSRCGFVVLEHTNAVLQNAQTLEEVLCHEIGHAIGLAHSSENPAEPNPTLNQAIMYYAAHQDGRGATLGAYDPPVVRQIHPTNNTPPFTHNRIMDVTTWGFNPPSAPDVNMIELRGYDLEGAALTISKTNEVSAPVGFFTLTGNQLKFHPEFYGDPRLDPGDGSYYEILFVRMSDGTHQSPYAHIRVISHNPDTDFPASDGIPDDWMTTYFGHANPLAGDKSRAIDDADNDGLNNWQEYRARMNPVSNFSAQRITVITPSVINWQAGEYELYELHGTTNFINWTLVGNPILTGTTTGTATNFVNASPVRSFRVLKVP